MNEIGRILLPFFVVILLGYGAGRLRLVREEGLAGLTTFVFRLALPVLFFRLIATTPIAADAWPFVLTTTFATYCAFAIAFSIGALINGGNVPEATVEGLIGSFSNVGALAPALVIAAFGTAAAVPMALIYSFDSAILFIATPLMMALGGTMRTKPRKLGESIVRRIAFEPLIIATLLGFIAAAVRLPVPPAADATLSLIGNAAAPGALFAMGVGLSLRSIGHVPVETPLLLLVKLIIHPLIVYLLLAWVGGFDPLWVHAAVLLAALPPAMGVYDLARQYGVYAERAAGAVVLGSVIAIATVTVTLILLLNGMLPQTPFR
jgi:predicted permease